MIRSKLIHLVVLVVTCNSLVTSVRVLDRFKARVDQRVVRRQRLRDLRELATNDFTPTFRLQDTDGNALQSGNNVTSTNQIQNEGDQPSEDHTEMDISESDLAEAALGKERTPFINSIFEQHVIFRIYHGNNLTKTTTVRSTPLLADTECSTTEKFAIIVHGWHENCYETFWVKDLEKNLYIYRGGCVICMDYSTFSSGAYTYLFRRFDEISSVLLKFVRILQYEGMLFDKLFMFGFSFGGQLVLDVGNQVGFNAIEAIDTCDMAGVGFDQDRFFKGIHFRNAAKNVQCIHTSIDKGTKLMNKCHQDWRMGQCGFRQPAAGNPPLGSHGLCPVFYNLAFEKNFYAESKPLDCIMLRDPSAEYPSKFKMGYAEKRKEQVRGELYAQTSNQFPYTVFNGS
ncbi:uncharacterized protein LOC135708296 [Ochlerotatus camptorhynchus]|uniref:uncharacterized protein LOC135708296 n=1 Tax=Ochlerotatus camptorhynchus TaxID=644619 RepID=UPI0031D48FED